MSDEDYIKIRLHSIPEANNVCFGCCFSKGVDCIAPDKLAAECLVFDWNTKKQVYYIYATKSE